MIKASRAMITVWSFAASGMESFRGGTSRPPSSLNVIGLSSTEAITESIRTSRGVVPELVGGSLDARGIFPITSGKRRVKNRGRRRNTIAGAMLVGRRRACKTNEGLMQDAIQNFRGFPVNLRKRYLLGVLKE
jgi:hypothetical protein